MLVALCDGVRISSFNAEKGQKYFCPICREKLVLHKGNKIVHHFKHKKKNDCPQQSESKEHMEAKKAFHESLIERRLNADMEVFVSTLEEFADRIADVFVESGDGRKVAIELQRSAISEENIRERTLAYNSVGVSVLWLPVIDICETERIQRTQYGNRNRNCPPVLMKFMEKEFFSEMWAYSPKEKLMCKYSIKPESIDVESTSFGGGYSYPSKRYYRMYIEKKISLHDALITTNVKSRKDRYIIAGIVEK